MAPERGVDISAYQNVTSWPDLAYAVEFVIMKATEGTSYVSSAWSENYAKAKRWDMLRGSYHFAQPTKRNAAAEAHHYTNTLRAAGFEPGRDLPPVLDLERTGSMSKANLTAWAAEFMRTVDNDLDLRGNQRCGLYVNPDYFRNKVDGTALVAERWLWLATWTDSGEWPEAVPGDRAMWQFTERAEVAGIQGQCDGDVANDETLRALAPLYYEGSPPVALHTLPEALAFAANEVVDPEQDYTQLCLAFVRRCWNHPLTGTGTAREAWERATHKHQGDRNAPPGAPVYWDTPSSTNFDHIALSAGGGKCWSNDIRRVGKIDLVSFSEIESKWGATYRGWSSDYVGTMLPLNQEDEVTEAQMKALVKLLLGTAVPLSEAERAKTGFTGDVTVADLLVQGAKAYKATSEVARLVTEPLSPEERAALAASIAEEVNDFEIVVRRADEEASE